MKTPHWFTRSSRVTSHLRIVTASTLIFAAAAMAVFAAKPRSSGVGSDTLNNGVYIVQMMLPRPSLIPATSLATRHKAEQGEKIDPLAANTVRYVGYLKGKHDEALQKVRGGAKIYDYAFSFNGFAAKLTEKQAAALAKQADVLAVTKDELRTATHRRRRLSSVLLSRAVFWDQLGGPTGAKRVRELVKGWLSVSSTPASGPRAKAFPTAIANGKLVYQNITGFQRQMRVHRD